MNNHTPDRHAQYRRVATAKNPLEAFRKIPVPDQGFVLLAQSKRFQQEITGQLTDDELIRILDQLDPDHETDLLQNINPDRRKRIVKQLGDPIREKVAFLLKFNPKTAAGMMTLEYVKVEKGTTFAKLSKIIEKHTRRSGKFPTILMVEKGFLVGEIPAHVLAAAKRTEKVEKYLKKIYHIGHHQDEDEVVSVFENHPHNKIVVLNDDGSILGIIYSEDVLQAIRKKTGESLRDFAGVHDEEDVLDPPLVKVKNRYKWLIINLGTAFLAASVVGLFEQKIATLTLLAVYMPVVAGMGGNAATQTLAVVVRGLALKKVELETGMRVIVNEVIAGGINGVINGVIVALVATLWHQSPLLGLIVAISMVANLVVAGFFGALVPLVMKKLGKDPAASATIFITTATDVIGFFVFLGLATLFL